MGEHLLTSLKGHISEVKPKGNAALMQKHSYSILKSVALGLNKQYLRQKQALRKSLKCNLSIKKKKTKSWWKPAVRKDRKDRTTLEVREEIRNFFWLPEVSRDVPNKKDVIRIKNAEGQKIAFQKKVMILSLSEAFQLYMTQHPDRKLSFSTFYKQKPKNVRRISETFRRSCLCTICCNMSLKCEALKKFVSQSDATYHTLPSEKKVLASISMCINDTDSDPKGPCLSRSCSSCGTKTVKSTFENLLRIEGKEPIPYHKWSYVKSEQEGKTKTIMSCLQKVCSFQEFFDELLKELEEYPSHHFRALWQQKQLALCVKNLANDEAVMIEDYSENYQCRFQNEVQSAFFDQTQVTLFPIMIYYKCSIEGSSVLVKHSIIGISDDPKHDSDAVKCFEETALKVLQDQGHKFQMIRQFTDGCAAQFKGRKAFADISLHNDKVERNFFETSHGKSVCDGLGAVIKNACHQTVISGKRILGNAKEVFDFCKQTLTHQPRLNKGDNSYSRRDFIFISKNEVVRGRNEVEVKTLRGTRKLHAVRSIGSPYKLQTKLLSCYCRICYSGGEHGETACENTQYWPMDYSRTRSTQRARNIMYPFMFFGSLFYIHNVYLMLIFKADFKKHTGS